MSTIDKDILYYINPTNTPIFPLPENALIVVTETRDRSQTDKLGELMPVIATWHDDLRLWYRGEDGNYYDGPMIGHGVTRSTYAIDIVGDEAIFGYVNNTYTIATGKSYGFSDTRRWSGQRMVVNTVVVMDHYGQNVVPAAPWAYELWPLPSDSDDIRAAKIALAKHRWETHQKHLGVIREGQRRDWLYILEGKDFLSEHGMKRPVYGAFVTGTVALPAEIVIREDELTSRSRSMLTALGQFRDGNGSNFDAQVQVPVQFVWPGNGAYREGQSLHSPDANQLNSHFQIASNNYEVTVSTRSVQPTITGVSY